MRDMYIGNIPSGNFNALCAQTDPEIFYAEHGSGLGSKDAKNICITSCETSNREECLEGALNRKEPYGVWGGMTTPERNRLLGKRAKNAS